MSRRRVANGKAARDRRYESAVRRQIKLHASSPAPAETPYGKRWYVEPQEMLRRGDTIDMFDEVGR